MKLNGVYTVNPVTDRQSAELPSPLSNSGIACESGAHDAVQVHVS
jgi:hypothetical protein